MIRTFLLLAILFSIGSVQAYSQDAVVLKLPSIDLEEEQDFVDIGVSVESFVDVAGIQFTLNWDPDVLSFTEVTGFGLEDMSIENFGTNDAGNGVLTFYWYDLTTSGVTVVDGHEIFTLQFQVVGDLHSFTQLMFSDDPTVIEVVNSDNEILPFDLENGMISVGGITSAGEPDAGLSPSRVSPNPFTEGTVLRFSLEHASIAQISIFNSEGKQVHQKDVHLGAGAHAIRIDRSWLPAPGNYYLQIKTETFTDTKKLIYVQ